MTEKHLSITAASIAIVVVCSWIAAIIFQMAGLLNPFPVGMTSLTSASMMVIGYLFHAKAIQNKINKEKDINDNNDNKM